jgi:uncharacterized RDD family membrane protein YckC
MPPEIQKLILDAFQQIGDAISKIAPEAWAMFLRQQMIMGVWGLFTTLLTMIGGLIGLSVNINNGLKAPTDSVKQGLHIAWCIVFAIFAVVGTISFFSTGGESLGRLLNPGYYAVMDIYHMVTGK